jgi:hypothetical protein
VSRVEQFRLELGSSEFYQNARVWFRTVFAEPNDTLVWGFHPCNIFTDPALYYSPYTVPNVGPRFLGGEYEGCWVVTFTPRLELYTRWWAQHGENPEARKSFEWPGEDGLYPPMDRRMEENPLCRWIREVHQYEHPARGPR